MTPDQRLTRQLVEALRARPPIIPEAGRLVWRAFVALSRSRSYGAVGPNPISYLEIEAWCRLMRMPLEPHHVEMICALDQAWLRADALPKPKGNLTAAAFDAVLAHAGG